MENKYIELEKAEIKDSEDYANRVMVSAARRAYDKKNAKAARNEEILAREKDEISAYASRVKSNINQKLAA